MSGAARWSSNAFGLSLEGQEELWQGSRSLPAGAPRTRLELTSQAQISDRWDREGATRLVDRRRPTGELFMSVDHHPDLGFRVNAPRHAEFEIEPDGRRIRYRRESVSRPWRFLRPLVAQALPTAAALSAREPLHASGVGINGRAIAIIGPSGAGKTSLALHLATEQTPLIADDVIAVGIENGRPEAFPGPPLANVDSTQLDTLPRVQRHRFGSVLGASDKLHIAVNSMASEPMPLDRIYFLRRSKRAATLRCVPIADPGPARVLGSAFAPHVATASRLTNQLQTCELIAACVSAFDLCVPAELPASTVANFVRDHCEE